MEILKKSEDNSFFVRGVFNCILMEKLFKDKPTYRGCKVEILQIMPFNTDYLIVELKYM